MPSEPSVNPWWQNFHQLHSAFESRNVWSLCNGFSETLKDGNLAELPKRTLALRGYLESALGLN